MAQRAVQSAASEEATLIGGRFVVDRVLGRGGMGEVLAVTERATGAHFALKRLLPGAEARHAMALSREFHRLASLDHPHIVRAFDFGMSEGAPYYTMELLRGSDVESLAPLPFHDVAAILRDVASALSVLHARRLVHRDVSGRNVWRTSDGVVKLIDFGTMTSFGVSNQLAGTLPFLAPEALRTRILDQRSDLYSLGALGYQLLTGRHAYPARSLPELEQYWAEGAGALRARMAQGDAEPLPDALEHIVEALIALAPEARPDSAAEVVDRLTDLIPGREKDGAARTSAALGTAAFAGRAAERTRFLELLRNALAGEGASTLLLGPRAVGRTRLLEEFAIEARIAGAVLVPVAGEQGSSAFSGATQAVLALLEAAPNEARAAALQHAPVLGHLGDEVRRALSVESSALAQFPELHGEARVRIQGALHELFREVATHKPLVLAVDDLQALDEASIAFFSALARDARDRRLLIAAAVRSEDERVVPIAVKRFAERAAIIALNGLSQAETEELLRSLFGEAPELARTAAYLWEKSEGNPGGLLSLCEYLQQTEQIRCVEGLWVLPQETFELTVPASLSLLDQARLGRLNEDDRKVASALCVLRGGVSLELCGRLSPLEPERTFAALTRLCAAGILVHAGEGYSFRTPDLRAYLWKQLPEDAAKRAHAAAAEALLAGAQPSVTQRLTAGLHLLRGGASRRGAELVHKTVIDGMQGMSEDDVQNAPLIEEAYLHTGELGLSAHERLSFLCLLAWAGYFVDRRFGTTYGDEALACAQEVCGMNLARKLRPWLGRKLGLFVALFVASARIRRLSKKSAMVPDLSSAFRMLMAGAGSLAGMHALCMDADKVTACARAIEPLTAFGEHHIASIAHRFAVGCVGLLTNRMSEARAYWAELVARLEDPRPIANMTDQMRLYYRAGSLYCWGSSEVWRDKSLTMELADRLEAQPVKLYQVSADQLRAVYCAQQGRTKEAACHRARVEMHALQRGATWQVELWAPASTVAIAGRQGDLISLKRAAGQLRNLAGNTPSLREYVDIARASYLALRHRYQEALEIFERVASTQSVESIGHANVIGALAQVYNALGRHADAERVTSTAVARMSATDLAIPGLALKVQIELAMAEAGLGRHREAAERLDALIEAQLPFEGPLTLGALYDARARVAVIAEDEPGAEANFAAMERWYRSTDCPSLIQYCDRVARRRLKGDVAGLETAWGSSSLATGGSYQASSQDVGLTLNKLLHFTTARKWVLCWYDASKERRAVQTSEPSIGDEVLAWLDQRIHAASDDLSNTLDVDEADVAEQNCKSIEGERWMSAVVQDEAGEILGAIALCDAAELPPLELLRTLAAQLKRGHRFTVASAS